MYVVMTDCTGCLPLPEYTCQQWGYESTLLPNLVELADMRQIEQTLNDFQTVDALRCHRYLGLYGCSVLLPKCSQDAGRGSVQVPPCRDLCTGIKAG